jgi:hypothetical protein
MYAVQVTRGRKDHHKHVMELNKYQGQLDRLRADAAAEVWKINGVSHSKQDIMFKVLAWISEGNTLKMFCEQPGAPAVGTIYRWFKNHTEFERDFRAAEEASAHILSDKALIEVLHLSEREDVPIVKLRYDALTRRAAQMNQRFQDKQVFRQEEDIKNISSDELKRKKEELLAKMKDELRSEGWVAPNEIDVQPEEAKDDE